MALNITLPRPVLFLSASTKFLERGEMTCMLVTLSRVSKWHLSYKPWVNYPLSHVRPLSHVWRKHLANREIPISMTLK